MTKEIREAEAPAAVAVVEAKKKKVAILGFTDSWKLAPFNDPDFEIWGLNELYQFLPRWTRWFEIHSRRVYENDRVRGSDHLQKLAAMQCPVYMHQHWDDIPNSIPYPLEEISKRFPNPAPGWKPYFNNSISYMIALALYENFDTIHVYGVDMAHDTEYNSQRPSCEYFVGIAQGMGKEVYIPPVADLLKAVFLYGFEEEACNGFDAKLKAREEELRTKFNDLTNQIGQIQQARAQYEGAITDVQHLRKNWRSSHSIGG